MNVSVKNGPAPRLKLAAATARDLMTPNPLSVREIATVREAVVLLTSKGISGAPVIDEAGRPLGVLSQADILVHAREQPGHSPLVDYYQRSDLSMVPGEVLPWDKSAAEATVRVADIMTPVVFSVSPETAASRVVEDMLALKVHRLFVVEKDGTLVGVISALDVLRHLRPES